MNPRLPKHDLVLLGAGHTNSHVLRMWRMAPIPSARLTCVTNYYQATYSGMLPGTLAGQYSPERMQIDLARLCAAAGVRLIRGAVTGLDLARRELLFEDRPAMPFDILSIGIGSTPRQNGVVLDETALPIKPMQTFLARLDARLRQLAAEVQDRPLRLAVVGAGAGGVEIAFCLPACLEKIVPGRAYELAVLDSGDSPVEGLPSGTARRVRREFARRGVELVLGQSVMSVEGGQIQLSDGSQRPVDLVLWATGAAPPPLIARLGLPTDEEGFLLRGATLETTAEAPIFIVGDTGSDPEHPTPKAGVYAVRQGPILWGNLHRKVHGRPLLKYEPQSGFLSLLNTGDGRAILSYKGLSLKGRWCWRLKDSIDSRFMDKYQDYTLMSPPPEETDHAAVQMRCAGCGGKVGGSVLGKVLERLEIASSPHVLLGLDRPDDAALLMPPAGRPLAATVDFFAAFLDDPYLVGRVAALNAASDLFAMGSTPLAALAVATLPPGPERQQEQLLYELLAGGLREFQAMGAVLAGGHTIEGPQTAIGYCMLADAGTKPSRLKSALKPGDALVLTKPLGSGVLLAAHMQARCRAEWLEPLIETLLLSNQAAAELADEFDARALTDITGFGLAGHLLEMLSASNVAAEVNLGSLPLMSGVEELIAAGLESTLAPANRMAEASVSVSPQPARTARYKVLFDPQTSGGLLIGLPEPRAAEFAARLADLSGTACAVLGRVLPAEPDSPRLRIEQ